MVVKKFSWGVGVRLPSSGIAVRVIGGSGGGKILKCRVSQMPFQDEIVSFLMLFCW